MAYRNFKKFDQISDKLGIRQEACNLFTQPIVDVEPSAILKEILLRARKFPLRIEKPRSEFLVAPILAELKLLNEEKIELFSGENLEGDVQLGLNGEVDFMFSNVPHSVVLQAPVLAVIEAKKGDIELSQPQCVAQMVGARLFNQNRKTDVHTIYGCVTTGSEWAFMKLEGQTVFVDLDRYYINDLSKLLGVFQRIIGLY
jgi:hypothetical protein